MAIQSLLIIVGVLAVLLVVGVPISYSIGISPADCDFADRFDGCIGRNRCTAYLRWHEQIQLNGNPVLYSGG